MRRNKIQLPDSLEMLLDTMCNTFGGIMFIALSLIVMSQLVTRTMKTLSPEEIDRRRIREVSREIVLTQQEISDMEYNAAADALISHLATKEQRKTMEEILEVQKHERQILDEIAFVDVKKEKTADRRKKVERRRERLNRELEEKKTELSRKENHTKNLENMLNRTIAAQREKLRQTSPRKMSFALETVTYLRPYWILLKDDQVYRWGDFSSPHEGEVRMTEHLGGKLVRLHPVRGTALGPNWQGQLGSIFSSVDSSSCFVSLVSDENSFSSLFRIRQYLRSRQFKVYWNINPEYKFVSSSDVSYRAAE